MRIDPREREFLAQFLGVAVVRLDVDRALEEERFVQTVELLLDGLGRALGGCDLIADDCLSRLPDLQQNPPTLSRLELVRWKPAFFQSGTACRTGPFTVIPGTEGAESPFFSPDGRWIAYFASGEIRKVPLTGGPSVRVSETPAVFGASWGDDGRIVFAHQAGGLWEVPAAGGGAPRTLTAVNSERGELSHRLPHVLPGGDAILFTITKNRFPRWDQTQIAVYSRRTGASSVLVDGGADARYVSTGHLVYVREGVLFAAPFDLQRIELTGGPVGVVTDVMQAAYFRGQNADTGAAQFAVSTTGTLVYLPGGTLRPPERSVISVDRSGRLEPLAIAPRAFVTLRLSPDGRQIALSTFGRDRDIWVYARKRGTLNRLSVPGRNGVPIWTRDGERITYAAGTSGPDNLEWVRADGGGSSVRTGKHLTNNAVLDISPDW